MNIKKITFTPTITYNNYISNTIFLYPSLYSIPIVPIDLNVFLLDTASLKRLGY